MWEKFQDLKKYGLRLWRTDNLDSTILYQYLLAGKKNQNLQVVFRVTTTKLKKILEIDMGIGTSTHVFCDAEYPYDMRFFDVFYFEKLLPFIRFKFVLLENDVQAWHHHTMQKETFLQD